MKFSLSALVSLTVSGVLAQEYNTSAPFVLKLDSSNDTIAGQYLGACHAGAAIEELCLSGTEVLANDYGTFTLNVSSSSETYETGPLVWNLQTSSVNVSSGLSFLQDLYSNIALPLFEPSTTNDYVGFDEDDKLFVYSGYYNESTFVPGVFPNTTNPVPLYHWYACYMYNLGYYYNALAWVTYGEPANPTCTAVNVTRVFV
ncbi:hypothetical protein VP1G_07755 [Cytospora mali]|uniref:DUF7907 domain-containing protein n=1 Tax=Cytospora mali TaxID=578113 RepID=A0A194V928_CYTMA|nr:hypothetical protein VP1G_07755 [Valsa mali var. pyri (nom. inval.)]